MEIRKPNRVSRSYLQRLTAPPARVFPLLCPVREADWIEGWDPIAVMTESGVAEPGCVFVTRTASSDAVWVVTRYEPDSRVEMIKVTPGVTACRLTIELQAAPTGCNARVIYEHTSLGPDGDDFVRGFTEPVYEQFMRDWEARLNHYLETGEKLRLAAR
jgi:hypothetical protein